MRLRVLRTMALAATTVWLVLAPTTASAQGAAIGVQGGINFANVSFDAQSLSLSFDQRIGGVFGAFIANDFNRNVGIQVDLLFSQKGTKVTSPVDTGTLEIRVDYFEIPVLARANLRGSSDKVVVHLFGGPSFAFRMNDQQLFDGDELAADEKLSVKSYDVGLTFGAAVEFAKRFVIDGRYTFGLVNIDEDPADEGEVTIKNRTFTLMFGVRFK